MFLCLGLPFAAFLAVACQTVDRHAPPPSPPSGIAAMVGTYGEGDTLLDVHEKEGKLYADGYGFDDGLIMRRGVMFDLLDARGRSVAFGVEEGQGRISALILGGKRLPRRDRGLEIQDRIRAGVRADIASLRARAMAMKPPSEPPAERAEELVDLATMVPGAKLDIRYATSNNFMGVPLYELPAAFMQRPAAEALARVAEALRPRGYGLKIFDAYRPWYVTRMFWDATPEANREFVADPSKGSRHNRGSAVDLTLYRLNDGAEVEMPGRYDEMTVRSYVDYDGGTSRQRWERDLLRAEMERQDFEIYPQEWWHFDYRDWNKYAVMNIPLPELVARRK